MGQTIISYEPFRTKILADFHFAIKIFDVTVIWITISRTWRVPVEPRDVLDPGECDLEFLQQIIPGYLFNCLGLQIQRIMFEFNLNYIIMCEKVSSFDRIPQSIYFDVTRY